MSNVQRVFEVEAELCLSLETNAGQLQVNVASQHWGFPLDVSTSHVTSKEGADHALWICWVLVVSIRAFYAVTIGRDVASWMFLEEEREESGHWRRNGDLGSLSCERRWRVTCEEWEGS